MRYVVNAGRSVTSLSKLFINCYSVKNISTYNTSKTGGLFCQMNNFNTTSRSQRPFLCSLQKKQTDRTTPKPPSFIYCSRLSIIQYTFTHTTTHNKTVIGKCKFTFHTHTLTYTPIRIYIYHSISILCAQIDALWVSAKNNTIYYPPTNIASSTKAYTIYSYLLFMRKTCCTTDFNNYILHLFMLGAAAVARPLHVLMSDH